MVCFVFEGMHLLGKKFSMTLLSEIRENKNTHFNQLLRNSKTTPKLLSIRLKELEKNGFIKKNPKNNYIITPKGKDFFEIVETAKKFAAKWNKFPHASLEAKCSECGLFLKS